VPRRRDERRFGPGPYLLGLERDDGNWASGFPFEVPAIAAMTRAFRDAPERFVQPALEDVD
jgi:hypothetical protein